MPVSRKDCIPSIAESRLEIRAFREVLRDFKSERTAVYSIGSGLFNTLIFYMRAEFCVITPRKKGTSGEELP